MGWNHKTEVDGPYSLYGQKRSRKERRRSLLNCWIAHSRRAQDFNEWNDESDLTELNSVEDKWAEAI